MALSGPNNPFGHPDAMVDRLIGGAYDKIKYVAEHIGLIATVADALKGVIGTQPLIRMRSFIVTGKLGELGSENRYPIPAYVEPTTITSINARVQIGMRAFCFNDTRFFHVSLEDGQLVLMLRNDAPVEFTNAPVQWFVICGA